MTKNKDMPELLPCPFCGEAPEVSYSANTISISCVDGFCGMASIHGPDFDFASTKEAWNTRHIKESTVTAEKLALLDEVKDGLIKTGLLSSDGSWVEVINTLKSEIEGEL